MNTIRAIIIEDEIKILILWDSIKDSFKRTTRNKYRGKTAGDGLEEEKIEVFSRSIMGYFKQSCKVILAGF